MRRKVHRVYIDIVVECGKVCACNVSVHAETEVYEIHKMWCREEAAQFSRLLVVMAHEGVRLPSEVAQYLYQWEKHLKGKL